MKTFIKTRLSIAMFVQFFIWGATSPIISLYLKECLNLTGAQVGFILGLSAISSIVSPALMTFIADRVISSERLLVVLNAVGGVLMYLFYLQTDYLGALALYTLYSIVIHPTMPLINAITFRQSPADRQKFGNIRVWGTVGWMSVAWVFSFVILPMTGGGTEVAADGGAAADTATASSLPILLIISSISAFVMAAYSFTITPKKVAAVDLADLAGAATATAAKGAWARTVVIMKKLFPADVFAIMLTPRVLAISFVAAAFTVLDKFYSFGTAPFLLASGFAERDIMPAMSLGQMPEIFAMAILGLFLKIWGAKTVLIIGVAFGIYRFAACSFAAAALSAGGGGYSVEAINFLIYSGLSVHGLTYTFTMVTAIICIDGFCADNNRAGVQQLFAVLSGGVGGFAGSYAAGLVHDLFYNVDTGLVNYAAYWAVPLVLSGIILAVVGFGIHTKKE